MSNQTLCIIDVGSGNLRSAAKAFEHVIAENNLSVTVIVSSDADAVQKADRVVLPGQGAFGDCMAGLKALPGMMDTLEMAVMRDQKPFLGICVGMQLLATRGYEHGTHEGLGWIPGEVVAMEPSDKALKIPHMGWNTLTMTDAGKSHSVLKNIQNGDHVYFVHSYAMRCDDQTHCLAEAGYGGKVSAIVGRDNMIGMQFHPEKSQKAGLALLHGFLDWS